MKKYTIKAAIWTVVILIAFVVGLRAIDDYLDRTAWERAAVAVYPMANQNIEWKWAGKDGAGR